MAEIFPPRARKNEETPAPEGAGVALHIGGTGGI